MKRNKMILLVLSLFIAVAAGCVSVGQASLTEAENMLKENRPAEALFLASQALVEDPKFGGAKLFLKEHTTEALTQIESYLAKTENTVDLVELEQCFDIYTYLVKFYTNLNEIGLPIVSEEALFGLIKGWEWSTEIKDYTPQAESTRQTAQTVFLETGLGNITTGELDNADNQLSKVVGKFSKDKKIQEENKALIANTFADYGSQFHVSADENELLLGIKSYNLALNYNRELQEAAEGLAFLKNRISEVYVEQAVETAKANTVDSLKGAIKLYETALSYNKENTRALKGKEEAITGIAEIYYQEAEKFANDRENADSIEKAVAAYEAALEWVADYKDAKVKSRRLYVSRELITLNNNLTATQEKFNKSNERVIYLAGIVDKANNGMEDLNYVADKVIQLNSQMKTINTVLSALSPIPVVGQVISVVQSSLTIAKKPVNAVAVKVKKIQASIITPTADFVAKIKENVDRVKDKMAEIDESLTKVINTVAILNDCLAAQENSDIVAEVEKDVKYINKVVVALNKGLDKVNSVQDKIEGTLKSIGESISVMTKVKNGLQKVMTPLDKIKSVTDSINSALNKKIKIPLVGSFSVQDALSKTAVVAKAAQKVLNPILEKLKINIPSLPGVDELNEIITKVEGYYDQIKEAADNIQSAATDILDVPQQLRDKVESIILKTGCQ